MSKFNYTIANINKKYLDDWIKHNPNLQGFSFDNNILTTNTQRQIDFHDFLAESLLASRYFNVFKYSMSANDFIKIINIYLTADAIMNNLIYEENEYISNIKINSSKSLIIVTNLNNYSIKDCDYITVLKLYDDLVRNSSFIKLSTFKNELKKNNVDLQVFEQSLYKNNLKKVQFFSLINKKDPLSESEKKYVDSILNFIYALKAEKVTYTGVVDELINQFNLEMITLEIYADGNPDNHLLNENQRYVYKKHLQFLHNFKKKLEFEEKEALEIRKASYGYSSLVLILASVIATVLALLIMFFIMY